MRAPVIPAAPRDALLATGAVCAAVWIGSRGGRDLDPALYGYLGAVLVATGALGWRASAFWRRPASAFYGRALLQALRAPRGLLTAAGAAGADLAAQRFLARRSRVRWAAHLALSLGTLASFAITLPLVFGWLRFEAEGQGAYRPVVVGIALGRLALGGLAAWLVFHALALAGVAVALGAGHFLVARWRSRARAGAAASDALAPLALLLAVALTGLALPATRMRPGLFTAAAWLHEMTVVTLLVAMPFSKLAHVLIRPLQLGVRVVRAASTCDARCAGCGAAMAPAAQSAAVQAILAARGGRAGAHVQHCQACRRRLVAASQSAALDAGFHPDLVVGPRPRPLGKAA